MSCCDATAFFLGLQHLDAGGRELFHRHDKGLDGREGVCEIDVDDALLRLVGSDVYGDAHASLRQR